MENPQVWCGLQLTECILCVFFLFALIAKSLFSGQGKDRRDFKSNLRSTKDALNCKKMKTKMINDEIQIGNTVPCLSSLN